MLQPSQKDLSQETKQETAQELGAHGSVTQALPALGALVGFCDVCLQLLDPHFQESSSSHFLRGLKGNTGPGQCGLARLAVTGIFLALLWFLSI